MFLVKLLILAALLLVFIQDILSRSVYWLLFPFLAVLFIIIRLNSQLSTSEIAQQVLINSGFLLLQLLMVSLYFSFKNNKWINITQQLLGWGDILFLACITFYLPFLNFLFFYIISLIVTLFFWLIWGLLTSKKNKEIPLAGFQAIIFMLFIASDWWLIHVDLTNDNWVLHLIMK